MNSNIIRAVFGAFREVKTQPLWRIDYGQILEIVGIDLPETFEVHQCNSGDATSKKALGSNGRVTIYDEYLKTGKDVEIYIYLHAGESDGETEYKITIPVKARPLVTNAEPTPEQQDAIGQLISALNNGVEAAEQSATESADSAAAALESEQAAKASEESAALSATNAAANADIAENSASASSASASASADSAALASEKAESAADSEAYVKGVADNIDSVVETAVEDYLETHPIESAVTSVNGQTGAVNIAVPSTAADVGAVAVAQGAAKANQFLVTDSNGNVTTKTLESWQAQSY